MIEQKVARGNTVTVNVVVATTVQGQCEGSRTFRSSADLNPIGLEVLIVDILKPMHVYL